MDHVYRYSACAPLVLVDAVVTDQWRRFYEETPTISGQKYVIHHEEFIQRLEDGSYRRCAHVTSWPMLNHDQANSNSRIDYSESDDIDPSIIQTDTNPPWEHVQLKPV